MENKITKLANILVNHSLKVEENEKVLITTETTHPLPLLKELIEKIYKNKGIPDIKIIDKYLDSQIYNHLNIPTIKNIVNKKEFEINNYDSFINIRYNINDYQEINHNQKMYNQLGLASLEVDKIRINQRKWVLLNYPSPLDAHKAKMPTDQFKNYAEEVMTVDYQKMYNDLIPLKQLMEKTDKVKIIGKDTNLTFSIKNMPAVICAGEYNIPDGEIFTAPIKNSVNGYITYNTDSPYQGRIYQNIKLTFKDGKIINATCNNDTESLNQILNTDEGARYIGEFSLGVNPKITTPIGNILYDEKIFGSIHFTPGRCYESANNNNISSIHWDLVMIGTKDYGGSEIYFDDELIRKDGLFVKEELKNLNK